ncbi:hypothetical protein [Nocardioides houyundeii]|uniref:hypothetical protein n=1 Tax=Nocardioides houyundeii TaxID=2045452 RepID=UPI000C76605B|nr:hypothetical protein [Nocardioides houyundeii]
MSAMKTPDSMPILSRGSHRRPSKGACFMEMASHLAGERWSDHPQCTHPLLAELARLVNDNSSDRHRSDLAILVPSVVGLRGTGLRWEAAVTAAVASHAITRVPQASQRALAAGLLSTQRMMETLGPVPEDLRGACLSVEEIDEVLALVPGETRWARKFGNSRTISEKSFRARIAPTVMRCAVKGVSAASEDCDQPLRELLEVAIDTARRLQEDPAEAGVSVPVARPRGWLRKAVNL